MTERWRLYLTPEERDILNDIETVGRGRMALDDERRARAVAADPLLAANGGDGPWTPSTDYGDDDAT